MDQILSFADSSFKYILLAFNLMTLIVIYIHKNKQKIKKQHHVLFVIAHPDDEVMFFRPSITSIATQYYTHLLCLSAATPQRQQQLKKSAKKLKLHKTELIKNKKFQDSMTSQWPKEQIKQIVLKYVIENGIKAIFTFDEYGVSNHSNHKSIFNALSDLHYPKKQLKVLNLTPQKMTQSEKIQLQLIRSSTIKIYHLRSVNLFRKYSAFLQLLIALMRDFCWINLNVVDAYRSMALHKSQFVWYRKLWVIFSQYQYINVYKMTRVKINLNSQPSSENHEKDLKKIQSQKSKIQ